MQQKPFYLFDLFYEEVNKKECIFQKEECILKKEEPCYKILAREEESSEISKNDNDNDYYCTLVSRSSRKRKNLAKFPMAKL